MFRFDIKGLKDNDNGHFLLIAGPCVVESEEVVMRSAGRLAEITADLHIPWVFKSSFKKANRTRVDSFTGIGDKKALELIRKAGERYDVPVITDVHTVDDIRLAADYVDILQIPAFLCRQTDLIVRAAKTGKWINIKKGQFMSPEAMKFAVKKAKDSGNHNIMITERGSSFGYTDLVVDFRSIPIMNQFAPVIMDITHSLQQPNQVCGVSGGRPDLIETMGKCGVAAGARGIFMETHPNPSEAKSDGANMLPLNKAEEVLKKLLKIHQAC